MKKTILPIGSVIKLQKAQRSLMIMGVSVRDNKTEKVFDYVAVPYPEGYIGSEYMFLCNHEDIASIDFLGFVNAEYQAFRAKIEKEG